MMSIEIIWLYAVIFIVVNAISKYILTGKITECDFVSYIFLGLFVAGITFMHLI